MTAGEWVRVDGVSCVACPGCAFTFDADHVTEATGEYDCPNCDYPKPPVEFWVVCGEGFGDKRSLAYWGPYFTEQDARDSHVYTGTGETIIEVPR